MFWEELEVMTAFDDDEEELERTDTEWVRLEVLSSCWDGRPESSEGVDASGSSEAPGSFGSTFPGVSTVMVGVASLGCDDWRVVVTVGGVFWAAGGVVWA